MSSTTKGKPNDNGQEEEEDDYMNMVFTDPTPSAPETSLQRRQRERREAAERARHKSKAELAAEEADKREAALARSLIHDDAGGGGTGPKAKNKSKGLAMMAKMGFRAGQGLGAAEGQQGSTEPVRIVVREDRGGIGLDGERKRKMREAYGGDGDGGGSASKVVVVVDEGEYRGRVAREREEARLERVLAAAQKVAEKMADEEDEEAVGGDHAARTNPRLLMSVNVLWRGLVRQREEAERERRMRHDLQQSLSRLPTYEDDDEDEDDRRALGKEGKKSLAVFEDLDEEDPELDEFNAKSVAERLQSVVDHLRTAHRYCFWCKYRYPDEVMEGPKFVKVLLRIFLVNKDITQPHLLHSPIVLLVELLVRAHVYLLVVVVLQKGQQDLGLLLQGQLDLLHAGLARSLLSRGVKRSLDALVDLDQLPVAAAQVGRLSQQLQADHVARRVAIDLPQGAQGHQQAGVVATLAERVQHHACQGAPRLLVGTFSAKGPCGADHAREQIPADGDLVVPDLVRHGRPEQSVDGEGFVQGKEGLEAGLRNKVQPEPLCHLVLALWRLEQTDRPVDQRLPAAQLDKGLAGLDHRPCDLLALFEMLGDAGSHHGANQPVHLHLGGQDALGLHEFKHAQRAVQVAGAYQPLQPLAHEELIGDLERQPRLAAHVYGPRKHHVDKDVERRLGLLGHQERRNDLVVILDLHVLAEHLPQSSVRVPGQVLSIAVAHAGSDEVQYEARAGPRALR
ncbi:hypothetical protein PpBr36_00206 [Pyricularia pennisetigena]|uniref:hypothetical protein n=1 Tax=Pyricularia pennisetigena TaxID=1578925 RepID=UPI0011514D4E|nr:hypothetical protein PpBr36_00206 [Pyricularia pennisetigena]TLS29413.1 hypothetical protein PpBr36_00206 [Pyricularia pennisetigena]